MNMIKCWALVLFDRPACHAWAHKQRIFDTPLKHYYLHLTDQKDFSYHCSGATKYHLVAVQEHFIACMTLVTFGQTSLPVFKLCKMPILTFTC